MELVSWHTVTETNDWPGTLTRVRNRLQRARSRETRALADARIFAAQAMADGMSERETAELLGINRMSLRAWLGKRAS